MDIKRQLSSVIEQVAVEQASQPKFIPLDSLISPDDLFVEAGNGIESCQLDMEDLKMLGFQVLDAHEIAIQRDSRFRQHIESKIGTTSLSKRVELKDNEDSEEEVIQQKPTHRSHYSSHHTEEQSPRFDIELVLNNSDGQGETMRSLQDLDTEFYKYKEKQMAINLTMTQEQVKKVQLQKLYRLVTQMQKVRVRELMQNALAKLAMKDERRDIVEQFIKNSQNSQLISLNERQVEMMFQNWAPALSDIPLSMRDSVARLCRPRNFKIHDKIIDFDQEEQAMHLIIEGNAVLFSNKFSRTRFDRKLIQVRQEQKDKSVLFRKTNFSDIVKVGSILLKYVSRNDMIKQYIARGKRRLEARDIQDRINEGEELGYTKLAAGSTFGDFSEAKGKLHKEQCVVVMSDTIKCLQIRIKDLQALFEKALTAENLSLIRGQISQVILSKNVIKKVARGFTERQFKAGHVLLRQGKPLTSILVIKSGTCEVFLKDHPLKEQAGDDKQKLFFQHMPVTGEDLCLGLTQGSMSKAFNYFPLKMISKGSWIGIETFFNDEYRSQFSIKCSSPVTVLEIGVQDFATKMPAEKMTELKNIAVMTQVQMILRMRQIADVALDIKSREELNLFHQQALKSLISLHPHASKRIMNAMGNQQQLEGYVRTARNKDAINIGQIKEVSVPNNSIKQNESMPEEGTQAGDQLNNFQRKIYIQEQTKVQALSMTGVAIDQELETRQQLINRKLDAIEEVKQLQRPKHMRNAQAKNQAAQSQVMDQQQQDEQKIIEEDLSQRKKRNLMALGISQNNAQMLSLTTVNGRPVAISPTSMMNINENESQQQSELAFQPSLAQLKEFDSLIGKRKNHPILQMRIDAHYKDRQKRQEISPQRQVLRSITFFNSEQAQLERKIQQNERKQVFKLQPSVEQATNLQPDSSLVILKTEQSIYTDNSVPYLREDISPKMTTQYSKLKKFTTLNASASASLRGGAASICDSRRYASQMLRSYASKAALSPKRSIGRGSVNTNSAERIITMPQAQLYHAHKLSTSQITELHCHKQVRRQYLTQTIKQSPSHDHQKSTDSIKRMMNQDSSTVGIEPLMLFQQDDQLPNAKEVAQEANQFERLPSSGASPTLSYGFRIDLPTKMQSISTKQQPSLNAKAQRAQEEQLASSQLELEMLKDIKEIAPERGSHRLHFVDLEQNKPSGQTMYEKMKDKLSQIVDESRYVKQATQKSILKQQTQQSQQIKFVESFQITDTQLTSADQNDYNEYFQQIQQEQIVTAAFRNDSAPQPTVLQRRSQPEVNSVAEASDGGLVLSDEEYGHNGLTAVGQVNSTDTVKITSESSDGGASVLLEIEQTEQSFGATNFKFQHQQEVVEKNQDSAEETYEDDMDKKVWTAQNVAVLNEILENRKKQIMHKRTKLSELAAKGLTTGTNIRRAKTLLNQSIKKEVDRSTVKLNEQSSGPQPNRESNYASTDEKEKNSSVEMRSLSMDAIESRDGLTISQVNLEPKPLSKVPGKTQSTLKQSQQSQMRSYIRAASVLNHNISPRITLNDEINTDEDQPIADSKFQKVKPKFASIATKSLNPAQLCKIKKRASGQNVLQKSQHSQRTNSIPDDLLNVMSNSDINFKTRKSPRYQNDRPGAVVAPGQKWRSAMAHNEDDDYDSKQKKRKMLRDDTELGMRNTLRIDNTSKSSIFPSIDGKKDKQSPIGTALNRRSDDDLLDDTYYRHRVIVHKDDSQDARYKVNGAGTALGLRKEKGDLNDISVATLPPDNLKTVPSEAILPTAASMDKIGTNTKQLRRNRNESLTMDVSSWQPEQQIQSVTKIKIAIEKSMPRDQLGQQKSSPRQTNQQLLKTTESAIRSSGLRYHQLKKPRQSKRNVESSLTKWIKTRAMELGERSNSPQFIEKNKDAEQHKTFATLQASPHRSPHQDLSKPYQQKQQKRDLQHLSMQVHRSQNMTKSYYEQKILRQNQQSSINKSMVSGVKSLLNTPPLEVNMPMILDVGRQQRPVQLQEADPQIMVPSQMIQPVTLKTVYAPRYKHMPVLIQNKAKLGSNPNKLVPGPAIIDTPAEMFSTGNHYQRAHHHRNHQKISKGKTLNTHKATVLPALLPHGSQPSLSNMLQMPSAQILDYVSQQSVNSSTKNLHLRHASLPNHEEGPFLKYANRAELTRAKFQRIKEEKLQSQQHQKLK